MVDRDPIYIAEDIVHEYNHAKMGQELKITEKEYNDPHLHPFLHGIGEALCYKKGAEFIENNGGEMKESHKDEISRFEKCVRDTEALIKGQTPRNLSDAEQKTFNNLKNLYDSLSTEERKNVKNYLDYYKKNYPAGK